MTASEHDADRSEQRHGDWANGSEADRAEGSLPWKDGDEDEERARPSLPPDAPEADVLEQHQPADLDEDEHPR
jgi:hypothetical protein